MQEGKVKIELSGVSETLLFFFKF